MTFGTVGVQVKLNALMQLASLQDNYITVSGCGGGSGLCQTKQHVESVEILYKNG